MLYKGEMYLYWAQYTCALDKQNALVKKFKKIIHYGANYGPKTEIIVAFLTV